MYTIPIMSVLRIILTFSMEMNVMFVMLNIVFSILCAVSVPVFWISIGLLILKIKGEEVAVSWQEIIAGILGTGSFTVLAMGMCFYYIKIIL